MRKAIPSKSTIEKDMQGKPVFITPGGWAMKQALYPQFPQIREEIGTKKVSAETPLAIERENKERGLAIGERTAVTLWDGRPLDYSMAIEALLVKDGIPL